MSKESQIIDQLKVIDQYRFERLIDNLLYQGAFTDIVPPKFFVESFGVNVEKERTIKSDPYPDAIFRSLGIFVEKSVHEHWAKKLLDDIDGNKKNKKQIKKFVFCTNQDTGDKTIKIKEKKVDLYTYVKKVLSCEQCFIIGIKDLLPPLQMPDFFYIRRHYLSIQDDFFYNPIQFLNHIRSTGPLRCDASQEDLERFAKDIDISFSPNGVIVLHNDDYFSLLHSLGLWAKTNYQKSNGVIEKECLFIQWPSNPKELSEEEIDNKILTLLIVWGAHEIENLTEYLKFVKDNTTLVFVSKSAFKDNQVIKKIRTFNPKISIQQITIPSIDQRLIYSAELTQHETKIREILQDNINLIMRLESLIYYYSPLYINDADKIKKICELLSINESKFQQLVEMMKNGNFCFTTGNILWLNHPGVAKKLLADFIESGTFEISELN